MRHFGLLGLALVACTASTAPSAPTEKTAPPVASLAAYPITVPVLDEAELTKRTKELAQQNPDWEITLDAFGFLSSATCKQACGHDGDLKKTGMLPLSQLDREQLEKFMEKNDAIVQLKAPGATKKYDNGSAIFWQQLGPSGVMAYLRISVDTRGVALDGHLWPALAPAGPAKPDAELEQIVKGLDPTPDLTVERTYRWTAKTIKGPLEIHEAACGRLAADDQIKDRKARPHRPCVDARTGEELTKDQVGMTIGTKNGVVTQRRLTKGE